MTHFRNNMAMKSLYLPVDLVEILEAKAEKENRSFNAQAVRYLAKAVKYSPAKPAA